jgi:two-component system, NarL family, nitrate/nitrite response regulator NarL
MTSVLVIEAAASDGRLDAVLRDGDYRVLRAASGERGLTLAREQRPELIIVDMQAAATDDFELIARLSSDASLARIPVILYSTDAIADEILRVVDTYGVARVIAPPCDVDEMIHAVREALSSPATTVAAPPGDEFGEHLQVLNAKLLRMVDELREVVVLAGRLQQSERRPDQIASPAASGPAARPQSLLSRRELEVLALLAEGATDIAIAGHLLIAEATVHVHVKHILRKLSVKNRTEAAVRYLRAA